MSGGAENDQSGGNQQDGKTPTPLFPAESGEEMAGRMAGSLCGAASVLMAGLADSLGIFKYMAGRAAETPAEVAAGTGLHERWVRELLYQLASAQLVMTDQDAGRFWLSEGQADVLANETGDKASPFFLGGTAALCVQGFQVFDRIKEVMRSKEGTGMKYDDYGKDFAKAVSRDEGVWARHALLPYLTSLPELHEKLEKGATCADVGCGSGEILKLLATAYPASTFHGYDTSSVALEAAKECLSSLSNTALKNPSDEPMPEKTYDFVITYDAIRDMTRPDEVLPVVRKALKDDAWGYLIADLKALEKPADMMTQDPLIANLGYSLSVMLCLNSGTSETGGLALGALGWHETLARKMLTDAGFGDVEILDWESQFNRFYHAKL